MLSLFPEILFLSPFAALLIRVALAILFAYAAWQHTQRKEILLRVTGFLELVAGATILVGIFTQGAALVAFIGIATGLMVPKMRAYPLSTTLLTLVMLATLVVTGAGALAFDLPL
jgi:uncharacterized membrane protein YphA (DoxX/SURF4 family)